MNFDYTPTSESIHPSALVVPSATVVGRVTLGEESSIWYQAVLRGDCESISVGARSNFQDGVILHADPGLPCQLGDQVTVGHGAIVHGAKVEDNCMIGIRAVILNDVHIGEGCLIAAGSVIPEGTTIPPYQVVMGIPGKLSAKPERATSDALAMHGNTTSKHYRLIGTIDPPPSPPAFFLQQWCRSDSHDNLTSVRHPGVEGEV